jgi:hypothetical protein
MWDDKIPVFRSFSVLFLILFSPLTAHVVPSQSSASHPPVQPFLSSSSPPKIS